MWRRHRTGPRLGAGPGSACNRCSTITSAVRSMFPFWELGAVYWLPRSPPCSLFISRYNIPIRYARCSWVTLHLVPRGASPDRRSAAIGRLCVCLSCVSAGPPFPVPFKGGNIGGARGHLIQLLSVTCSPGPPGRLPAGAPLCLLRPGRLVPAP